MSQFPITNKAVATMIETMHRQDMVGVQKYGKPLSHLDNYNWLEMFLEEMADGLKYIQCEMERKNDLIKILEAGEEASNPRFYISMALSVLKMEGTSHGKNEANQTEL
ncbi:hypothetical protein M3175_07940 [Robertmurraya korlensis]|uniref:hypothetical protein n=1 Tax=Robertmurraya korlensis TaxID=519977 RepID=UPI00203D1B8D|nr:hypothetical protein [Robertmurraya korlensis]MCM3600658.1 hypothetical protein [Robertmurraya korlensis]